MTKKRARITEANTPLSPTDQVLAGFEQLSKLTSDGFELPESNEPNTLTSGESELLSSNKPKALTSDDYGNLTDKQEVRLTSNDSDNLTNNELVLLNTEEPSNSGSRKYGNLTRNKVSNFEGQQSLKLTIDESNNLTTNKTSNLTMYKIDKLTLRRATFQLSENVLDQLDRLHLELQLELGKKRAPYKEVIVEEAIASLLKEMVNNKEEWLEVLQTRQGLRD